MSTKIKIILLVEVLYTFPIWIILVLFQILDAVFSMIRHYKKNGLEGDMMRLLERTKSRIISYKNKRFFNIFLSTITWICLYKIFLK
jgi:hypothetical protein